MMAIFMLANAITFLIPLYIQMVQGRTSFETAVAMIPYQLAVFAAAIFVLGLYDRLTPRQIARYSFVLVVRRPGVAGRRDEQRVAATCSWSSARACSASGRARWRRCCSTCW